MWLWFSYYYRNPLITILNSPTTLDQEQIIIVTNKLEETPNTLKFLKWDMMCLDYTEYDNYAMKKLVCLSGICRMELMIRVIYIENNKNTLIIIYDWYRYIHTETLVCFLTQDTYIL